MRRPRTVARKHALSERRGHRVSSDKGPLRVELPIRYALLSLCVWTSLLIRSSSLAPSAHLCGPAQPLPLLHLFSSPQSRRVATYISTTTNTVLAPHLLSPTPTSSTQSALDHGQRRFFSPIFPPTRSASHHHFFLHPSSHRATAIMHVAVIGAGFSGISTAKYLTQYVTM